MPKLIDNKIANRYARALFDATLSEGKLEICNEELASVAHTMRELPQLAEFFANPAVPQAEKTAFVQQQFASKLNPWVGNLLKLLADNGRMAIVPQVSDNFAQLVNLHNNVATAEVITAVEIDAKQLEQLQKGLQSRFGFKRVDLHNRVEPGILGGAIVKIQDQILDGSFSGKLEALKKQLA